VWLDDDLVDRAAPAGWTHVTTSAEAIALLDSGHVVELALDHDLGDDERFGRGVDVVDWLAEQQEVNDRSLWPRDGIVLHTANPAGRDTMALTVQRYAGRRLRVRLAVTPGGKTSLRFAPHKKIAELVVEAAALAGTAPGPVALYLSAGTDTRPFVMLHPAFLASRFVADAPAPAVFVYVDRQPAERHPLDWHDGRTSVRESICESRPRVTVGVVDVASERPDYRRRLGLVRLHARNQEAVGWMRAENWLPDIALTVRDGCRGWGGQDCSRCEARLRGGGGLLASLAGPERLRWWVTDHVNNIKDPAAIPLRDGDEITPTDERLDFVLRRRAKLSEDWGWRVDCVQGATLFEVLPRPRAADTAGTTSLEPRASKTGRGNA
jgi:hypothetical protein